MTDIKFEDASRGSSRSWTSSRPATCRSKSRSRSSRRASRWPAAARKYLEEAEKRIELLTKDESGLLKAEPFGWDKDE